MNSFYQKETKTLYLERSTGDCRDGRWVDGLDLSERPVRIVVGTGPGSFAGIRSALAFAQGYRLGSGCEVLGLSSACAVCAEAHRMLELGDDAAVSVVGDARQGKFWVADFIGLRLVGDVGQVDRDELPTRVPKTVRVVSPDHRRIGPLLAELFPGRYDGECLPTAEGLADFAAADASMLREEPRPYYLNPAVRTASARS